jgi:hypothetical protein
MEDVCNNIYSLGRLRQEDDGFNISQDVSNKTKPKISLPPNKNKKHL